MVKSETVQNSRPISMLEALKRKHGGEKHDEVPIPGKDAKVNVIRGTVIPKARKLAGFLANATAYHAVEAYRARFDDPQERRRNALIKFAQNHEGVRGIVGRTFRLSVHPETTISPDADGLRTVLKDQTGKALTTTWTASVTIPDNHETPFGVPLTPDFLTKAFNVGVLALAGLTDEQVQANTKIATAEKVDTNVVYDLITRNQIPDEDVELMGTAREKWVVRPTTPLAGASTPELGLIVADTEPVMLQP